MKENITAEALMSAFRNASDADKQKFIELVQANHVLTEDEIKSDIINALEDPDKVPFDMSKHLDWLKRATCSGAGSLQPEFIPGRGIRIPVINKVLDLHDLNNGEEMKWDEAMAEAKNAGKSLPTRDEWYIILYFKKEIQQLLEENGGDKIKSDYYWSSTEYLASYAWYVNFANGYVSSNHKYNGLVARAVADI